jgi:hypothetical protein
MRSPKKSQFCCKASRSWEWQTLKFFQPCVSTEGVSYLLNRIISLAMMSAEGPISGLVAEYRGTITCTVFLLRCQIVWWRMNLSGGTPYPERLL